MHTTARPRASLLRCRERLHTRWQRLHVDVRCALHVDEPLRIRQYLHCGHKLAALGLIDEVLAQAQMLQTLLRTARDAELPNFWRSACLELAPVPLRRLRQLIGRHDPLSMQAIEAAVNTCARQVPLPDQHLEARA